MHTILYTVREIPADQLPTVRDIDGTDRAATDAELLNFGFQRLEGDLFSCAEQYHGDVAELEGRPVRVWRHHDEVPWLATEAHLAPRTAEEAAAIRPHGELLAHGRLRERFDRLPPAVRDRVVRADVVRATDPDGNARAIVEANLVEQMAVIEAAVGDISGTQLVDFDEPGVLEDEAQRVAELPDSPLEHTRCAMGDCDPAKDIILEANIPPHRWEGEL